MPKSKPKAPSIAPRKTPSQNRAAITVANLLDATAAELIAGGYDHMSTNKIARRANVSIGSLYQYFPSKEALVVALKMRMAETERDKVLEALAAHEGGDLRTLSGAILRSVIAVYLRQPDLYRAFATQVPPIAGLEPNWEADQLIGRVLLRYLHEHPGMASATDPEMAVFFVLHAVDGIIIRALLQRPHYLHEAVFVEELTRLIISVLGSDSPSA